MLVDTQMCVISEGKYIFIFGVPPITGLYNNLSHPGTFHVPPGTFHVPPGTVHRSLGAQVPQVENPWSRETQLYQQKFHNLCKLLHL